MIVKYGLVWDVNSVFSIDDKGLIISAFGKNKGDFAAVWAASVTLIRMMKKKNLLHYVLPFKKLAVSLYGKIVASF